MTWAVEMRGVTKDFVTGLRGTRLRAVDRLTLRIAAGQVCALLGPNGSGKSTTLKILLGLMEPTAGTGTIFGIPCRAAAARRCVGYLPESPYFYRFLTGRELVEFHGRLGGVERAALGARVDQVIAWVGLERDAGRRLATYSKGMLQRIGLAQALVHRPRLLILDEPIVGMDRSGLAAVAGLIRRMKLEGTTVLITSHQLDPIEDVCDRVAVLDRGRLVLDESVEELTGGVERLTFTGKELPPEDSAELKEWLRVRGWAIDPASQTQSRLEQGVLARIGRPDPLRSA